VLPPASHKYRLPSNDNIIVILAISEIQDRTHAGEGVLLKVRSEAGIASKREVVRIEVIINTVKRHAQGRAAGTVLRSTSDAGRGSRERSKRAWSEATRGNRGGGLLVLKDERRGTSEARLKEA